MTSLRVAAVQASYVLMDQAATLGRASDLTAEAAGKGAQLVAFPEVFVPGAVRAGRGHMDPCRPVPGSGQRR